jgi:hypothetical protein
LSVKPVPLAVQILLPSRPRPGAGMGCKASHAAGFSLQILNPPEMTGDGDALSALGK